METNWRCDRTSWRWGLLAAMLVLLLLATLSGCFLWNLPPTASFTVSENPRPGIEVTFTNTSTDPNGFEDLREFVWEFGDGTTADTMNAKHVYEAARTYTVKLTVFDAAGDADSYRQEIDVRSRIFDIPDVGFMGWRVATGGLYGQMIPEHARYQYSSTEQAWVVCYAISGGYLIPQNIVFWVPVGFVDDLSQSIILTLSWQLMTLTGNVQYTYRDPESYALGDLSRVGGINAIWDLWHQTEYGAYLSPGRYKTRLTITETLSGEVFVWDFPFVVLWGGY